MKKGISVGGLVTAPRVRDPLDSPFAGRRFDRELKACRVAGFMLSFCRYRRAVEHFCYARPSSRPNVLGLWRGRSSFFAVGPTHPLRWHEVVYRRGLSSASGCFVFEEVEELADGALVVLAARQGRGCSLRLAYALARKEQGFWRTGWGGLPAVYRAAPPAMGLMGPDINFAGEAKPVFWSNHPVGEALYNILGELVGAGFLESRDEPDNQYRWNPAFVGRWEGTRKPEGAVQND